MVDFEDFYRSSYSRVATAVTFAFPDRDAALEAVDEAFVRAYMAWPRVASMASPVGWVCRVAFNRARREGRRGVRREFIEDQARAKTDPNQHDSAGADEEFKALIAGLPPRQQSVIVLRYLADLSENEIAEALGIRRGTVAAHLSAAHASLRLAPQTEP